MSGTGRITVWGAGAIGGTVGSHLCRAGHDIVFVDSDAAYVEAITRGGIYIDSFTGPFRICARAIKPEQVDFPLETVLLAVKATWARTDAGASASHR